MGWIKGIFGIDDSQVVQQQHQNMQKYFEYMKKCINLIHFRDEGEIFYYAGVKFVVLRHPITDVDINNIKFMPTPCIHAEYADKNNVITGLILIMIKPVTHGDSCIY